MTPTDTPDAYSAPRLSTVPLAVSINEAGRMVSLSPATVRRLINLGEFPHFRVETRVLVPVAALAQWVEARTIAAVTSPPG